MAARSYSLISAAMILVASGAPALAHGGEAHGGETAWMRWGVTWDIAIPVALLALVYGAGIVRRAAATGRTHPWRHAAFFAGLGFIFLALQSPIDAIAERLFFAHQGQHVLLRMLGPMLIALSWPQAALVAGAPTLVRRGLLAPVLAAKGVRAAFGVAAHPVVATAVFIAALYLWQIPRAHNLALVNEPVHYAMHATMLFAGMVFWWRVFDRRPAPHGLRYGVRLMMLWLVILSNIVLGTVTTLKSAVLYGAYDRFGRLFDYPALADEQLGGMIIWIPSSMMCVVAVLIVVHMWGRHETKVEERRASRPSPHSRPGALAGSAVVAQQRPRNRALALGFVAFSLTVFLSALLVGVLNNLSGDRVTGIEASADPARPLPPAPPMQRLSTPR